MQKFLPIFLLVFISPLFSFSQQVPAIQWTATLGGSGADAGGSILQTADSGFLVLGNSASADGDVTNNHGGQDFWLVKLNKSGVVKWKKNYGGTGDDYGYRIIATKDGGYLLGGRTFSINGDVTSHFGSTNFSDVWIIKIDSTGVIQWQKNYGGTGDDELQGLIAVPGGYLFNASSNSNDGLVSGNHGGNDYWVVKIDDKGTLLWQKSFGGSGDDMPFANPVFSKDSGYVVTGKTSSLNGQVTGNHGGYDIWVIKLSATGSLLWQSCYGGNSNEVATAVVQNFDSTYTITGASNSLNTGQVTNAHGQYDFWVINISQTGKLNWQKTLGGSNDDWSQGLKITADSGYILSGHSASYDGDATYAHGMYDFWIVKLDKKGDLQWQKSVGGSNQDDCFDIITTKDKGYAMVGETYSNNGDVIGAHGNNDYFIVKFGEDSLLKNDSVLAVTLLAFNGIKKEGQNILSWSAEKQINFSHFELQRSENGRQFNSIGIIAAINSQQGVSNYSYVDDNALNKSYYYRLKQVDKDNTTTFSRIIFIDGNIANVTASIFPNPAQNNVTIRYNSRFETDVVVNCFSTSGQLVGTKKVHLTPGTNNIIWDISRYATGSYIFVVNNKNIQQAIIKIK